MHQFQRSLHAGSLGEQALDAWFKHNGYHIINHQSLQRIGVDRVLEKDGRLSWIEYKTDMQTAKTGNVFIETVSVDNQNKAGWAVTSKANLLVYMMPNLYGDNVAVLIPMDAIRTQLAKWHQTCRQVYIPNTGMFGGTYYTVGLLVPLTEFLNYCTEILVLPEIARQPNP